MTAVIAFPTGPFLPADIADASLNASPRPSAIHCEAIS
jgi:hypothetical protein